MSINRRQQLLSQLRNNLAIASKVIGFEAVADSAQSVAINRENLAGMHHRTPEMQGDEVDMRLLLAGAHRLSHQDGSSFQADPGRSDQHSEVHRDNALELDARFKLFAARSSQGIQHSGNFEHQLSGSDFRRADESDIGAGRSRDNLQNIPDFNDKEGIKSKISKLLQDLRRGDSIQNAPPSYADRELPTFSTKPPEYTMGDRLREQVLPSSSQTSQNNLDSAIDKIFKAVGNNSQITKLLQDVLQKDTVAQKPPVPVEASRDEWDRSTRQFLSKLHSEQSQPVVQDQPPPRRSLDAEMSSQEQATPVMGREQMITAANEMDINIQALQNVMRNLTEMKASMMNRPPGMQRDALLLENARMQREIGDQIKAMVLASREITDKLNSGVRSEETKPLPPQGQQLPSSTRDALLRYPAVQETSHETGGRRIVRSHDQLKDKERSHRRSRSRSHEKAAKASGRKRSRSRSRERDSKQSSRYKRSRSRHRSRGRRSRSRHGRSRDRSRDRNRARRSSSRGKSKRRGRSYSKGHSRSSSSSRSSDRRSSGRNTDILRKSSNTKAVFLKEKKVTPEERELAALELAVSMYTNATEFYNSGTVWCQKCEIVFNDTFALCRHLHSEAHQLKIDPEFNKPKNVAPPAVPAGVLAAPSRDHVVAEKVEEIFCWHETGYEFLMPLQAFFCSMCCEFSKDIGHAEEHVRSQEHNNKFKQFLKDNAGYEVKFLKELHAAISKNEAPVIDLTSDTKEDKFKIKFTGKLKVPPPVRPVSAVGSLLNSEEATSDVEVVTTKPTVSTSTSSKPVNAKPTLASQASSIGWTLNSSMTSMPAKSVGNMLPPGNVLPPSSGFHQSGSTPKVRLGQAGQPTAMSAKSNVVSNSIGKNFPKAVGKGEKPTNEMEDFDIFDEC